MQGDETRCPDCGGSAVRDVSTALWSKDGPLYGWLCEECGCTFFAQLNQEQYEDDEYDEWNGYE